MSSHLLIGEVADLFGVTTKTLRHYEKLGLLMPDREENGYRVYSPDDILRLQRIRRLQALGLSLRQIESILNEHDDEGVWNEVLNTLLQEIDAEIELLEDRRERIEQALEEGVIEILEVTPLVAPEADAVEDYLDNNLPQASLQAWQHDKTVYAFFDRFQRAPGDHSSLRELAGFLRGQAAVYRHHLRASDMMDAFAPRRSMTVAVSTTPIPNPAPAQSRMVPTPSSSFNHGMNW